MNAPLHTRAPATPAEHAFIRNLASALIDQANRLGIAVTIERQALAPLAMGHHAPVITTWPLRGRAHPALPHNSAAEACVRGLHNVIAADTTPRGAA
ncbi:MAG: hypothetical protein O9341_18075 [Paucibacter sp.]|nr:hypothetical protein [Roseateles sp.]